MWKFYHGVHKLSKKGRKSSRLHTFRAVKVLLIIECNYIINLNLHSPFFFEASR